MKVWDPFVRIAHWALVACVATAWLTRHGGGVWHEWMGYGALAIAVARAAWGFSGTHYARFGDFLRPPAQTFAYARLVLARREPRYIGHNPLGGWMIAALLLVTFLTGASGWLYTTDRFWGVAWVGELHESLTNFLLVLVALHVGGVAYGSLRHGENLVAAMIHGRKVK